MSDVRKAVLSDLSALVALENKVFPGDRLSSRRFRYFIQSERSELWVVGAPVQAYALVLFHRGTGLARLYSLAVDPSCQGKGFAGLLLKTIEERVLARAYVTLRLEVREDNQAALGLYHKFGYRKLKVLSHYYQDGANGLKLEKRLHPDVARPKHFCYYPQTTPFTCGPASLLMAMHSLQADIPLTRIEELNLWRESTTIYLTTGHGGTSPQGLALAAMQRGMSAELWLSSSEPPFLNSVRDQHKRDVLTLVADDFQQRCLQQGVAIQTFPNDSLGALEEVLQQGARVLLLISTYRLNGNKAPHWVWLVAMNEDHAFINDPDIDDDHQQNDFDNVFVPIPKSNLSKMMQYGKDLYKAALIIRK